MGSFVCRQTKKSCKKYPDWPISKAVEQTTTRHKVKCVWCIIEDAMLTAVVTTAARKNWAAPITNLGGKGNHIMATILLLIYHHHADNWRQKWIGDIQYCKLTEKRAAVKVINKKKYCRWRGSRCWKNACKIKVMHKRKSVSIGTTARRWCFSFLRCWCCLWLCWWGRLNVQWIRPIANYQWKYKKAPMLRRPDVAATEVAEEEEEEETAHADDEWNEWILSEGRSE